MRGGLKKALELLLLRGGAAALSRKRRRGRDLVLAYHNVVPSGERSRGQRSLHLPQSAFGEHLDRLGSDRVRVVPLAALLEPASDADGDAGSPRVAITFDDAYAGALTAGVEELRARGCPATFFVAPGLLGGRPFWWDVLAETGGLDEATRERALVEEEGRADRILRRMAEGKGDGAARALPDHARSAREETLEAVARVPGITFASHTWSHPNLTRVSPEDCRRELDRSLGWLRARFSNVEPWLAYPYGLHSPDVESAAREAGHRAAVRITGGWLPRRRVSPYAVPRLNVPAGLSGPGFSLRLAGLFCR